MHKCMRQVEAWAICGGAQSRALKLANIGQRFAVGGAPMVAREREVFRRDCGVVRVSGHRNGGVGCIRDAQAALCGALVLVALVKPSDRPRAGEEPTKATTPRARTERSEENRVRRERATDSAGARDEGARGRAGRSEAGELLLISSYIKARGGIANWHAGRYDSPIRQ